MRSAPAGTVALVFTDVEGSTERWERLGDAFRAELDRHDAVMRACAAEHRGYEVKTEGDAFMLAFDGRVDAVAFCLAAQARLELPVRMGVHVGEPICRPDPVTGRMDYFGPVVNKAARVQSAGHGGQIVVSDEARCAVDAPWTDLGEHRLKGLDGVHRLWQVGAGTFAALRTVPIHRTNLVAEPTGFVGREAERRAVAEALDAGVRLVTLLGPGGAGKTRIATEIGLSRVGAVPGGVWMARLAGARDTEALVRGVAAVLEVPLRDADPVAQVGRVLDARSPELLVLDNLEQVTGDARATVRAWRAAAPEASFLCTSREPLRLPGEQLVPVDPLPVAAGVALFVQRARALRPDLAEDDPAIEGIVVRLDGLPLAIELAAARSRSLPPREILARLDRRFELLRMPGRPDRQATLRAALDWSWDLLDEAERSALAQVSVFRGAFDLDAAEAVVAVDGAWVLDVVTSLHDRSMLRSLDDPHRARFSLLESVRAYAAERLDDPLPVEIRHGAWFSALAEPTPDDLEDLLAAAFAALDRGDAATALGAADRAIRLLRRSGPLSLVADLATRLVPLLAGASPEAGGPPRPTGPLRPPEDRAREPDPRGGRRPGEDAAEVVARAGRALVMSDRATARRLLEEVRDADGLARCIVETGLADLARIGGATEEAASLLRSALDRATRLGDGREEGHARRRLGLLAVETGRHEEAAAAFEECLALARRLGDPEAEALTLSNLAIVHAEQGAFATAVEDLEAAAALHATRGDPVNEAVTRQNRANLLIELGRYDEAEEGYRSAIASHRETGMQRFEGAARTNVAVLYATRGRFEDALASLEEALPMVRAAGDRRFEGIAHGTRADVRLQLGDAEAARADAEVARAIAAEVGDRRFEALNTLRLAFASRALGEAEAARRLLEEAAGALTALGDAQNLAVARTWLAHLALDGGDAQAARTLATEAAEALRSRSLWMDLLLALAVLGLAERALGRDASQHLAEAEALAVRLDLSPRLHAARVLAELRTALRA